MGSLLAAGAISWQGAGQVASTFLVQMLVGGAVGALGGWGFCGSPARCHCQTRRSIRCGPRSAPSSSTAWPPSLTAPASSRCSSPAYCSGVLASESSSPHDGSLNARPPDAFEAQPGEHTLPSEMFLAGSCDTAGERPGFDGRRPCRAGKRDRSPQHADDDARAAPVRSNDGKGDQPNVSVLVSRLPGEVVAAAAQPLPSPVGNRARGPHAHQQTGAPWLTASTLIGDRSLRAGVDSRNGWCRRRAGRQRVCQGHRCCRSCATGGGMVRGWGIIALGR